MNCPDARERFSGLIDDALSAEERAALAAHLAECADCQRELARLRGTVAMLSRVEPPRVSPGFADRVLAATVRPASWRRRLASRLFLPLSVKLPAEAAALVLVAGLAIYVFQRTPELERAARQSPPPPAELRPSPAPSNAPSPELLARRGKFKLQSEANRSEGTGQLAPRSNAAPAAQPGVEARSRAEAPGGAGVGSQPDARLDAESKSKAEAPGGGAGGSLAPADERTRLTTSAPASPPTPTSEPSPVPPSDSGRPKSAVAPTLEPAVVAPPSSAPARERTADSGGQSAARARQAPLGPRAAINAPAGADLTGRLTVKDRSSAESALLALLAEARGTLVSRRDEPNGAVIEMVVPRGGYTRFSEGLERIGTWQPEGEPAALPAEVRITLRLAQ